LCHTPAALKKLKWIWMGSDFRGVF